MRSDGPSWVREFPADLAAVLVFTLLTLVSVFVPVVRETPLRVALGLPFLFFVPGYVLIAALFPEAYSGSVEGKPIQPTDRYLDGIPLLGSDDQADFDGITPIERIGLSVVGSLVVVAVVGLVLNNTPFGLQLVPVVGSMSAVVVALVIVAVRRRLALPVVARFRVPWRARLAGLHSELFHTESRVDVVLNIALVLAVSIAALSVGYAVVVPTEGQSYTALYLLTEDQGELVADGYPSEFAAGEPHPLVVGIENREHEPVSYTLLVEIHRVRLADDSMRVLDTERLNRFQPRLEPNETWQRRHAVAPTMAGERLRLTYLLYREPPPPEPSVDSAYRELHLWVNVTAG